MSQIWLPNGERGVSNPPPENTPVPNKTQENPQILSLDVNTQFDELKPLIETLSLESMKSLAKDLDIADFDSASKEQIISEVGKIYESANAQKIKEIKKLIEYLVTERR